MKVYYENADNWYDQFIEDPLIDIVKFLRNNGINTECSCAHEGYIQCQYNVGDDMAHLHRLLFLYHHEHGLPINYKVTIEHTVRDGHSYDTLNIDLSEFPTLPKKRKKRKQKEVQMRHLIRQDGKKGKRK